MQDGKYQLVLSLRQAALRFDGPAIQQHLPPFLASFAGQLEPSIVTALQTAKVADPDELDSVQRLILVATEDVGPRTVNT